MPICPGHKLAAKRTISKTPSYNGRAFYSCAFKAESCDFFRECLSSTFRSTGMLTRVFAEWEDKLPGYRGGGVKPEPGVLSASPQLVRTRSSTRSSSAVVAAGTVPVTDTVPTLPVASGSESNQPDIAIQTSTAGQPIASPSATPEPPKRTGYGWNNARARLLEVKKARAAASKVKIETTPSKDVPRSAKMASPGIQRAPSSPLTPPPTDSAESVLQNPNKTLGLGGQPGESISTTQSQTGGETVQNAPARSVPPPDGPAAAAQIERLKEAFASYANNSNLNTRPAVQAGVSRQAAPVLKRPIPPETATVDQHRDKRPRVEQPAESTFRQPPGITSNPGRNQGHFPVESTDPPEWRYLSEGGANVVLIYVGSNEVFVGKALRIRKENGLAGRDEQFTNDYWRDWLLPEVMETVQTGARQYLPCTWRIDVQPSWIKALDNLIWSKRPATRQAASGSRLDHRNGSSLVVLTENLVGGTGQLAIEIKPKAGFVPGFGGLDPRFSSIKTSVCKYCLKRAIEVPFGNRHRYGFCPIDLYNNRYGARTRALDYLTDSWRAGIAGNNMRVFVDGKVLNPKTVPKNASAIGDYRDPAALATLLENALTSSRILRILVEIQRCFDPVDIQAVGLLAEQQSGSSTRPFGDDLARPPEMEELRRVCQERFQRDAGGKFCGADTVRPCGDLRCLCLGISLAAIVKDCSIILTWNLSGLATGRIPETPTVRLVDLDLKPIANLNKWWKQDQDLCKAVHFQNLAVPCGASGVAGIARRPFAFPRPNGDELAAEQASQKLEKELARLQDEALRLRSKNTGLEQVLRTIRGQVNTVI